MCDDDSTARGPSQRFRYFAHSRKVQPSACRSLCISASGRNNSSRGQHITTRRVEVFIQYVLHYAILLALHFPWYLTDLICSLHWLGLILLSSVCVLLASRHTQVDRMH